MSSVHCGLLCRLANRIDCLEREVGVARNALATEQQHRLNVERCLKAANRDLQDLSFEYRQLAVAHHFPSDRRGRHE